jgi:hypothetical protein
LKVKIHAPKEIAEMVLAVEIMAAVSAIARP